jgi:hypothetical protein
MYDQLSLFESGLFLTSELYKHANSELVAEATRATVDDYLKSPHLISGEGRVRQLELLQELREKVGLPRFEMQHGIEPNSDILNFDFGSCEVINSIGFVIHKFGGDKKIRSSLDYERRQQDKSTAMRQVFNLSNIISKTPGWILTTDMYGIVDNEADKPQAFNNRFLIVKKILGGRIATTDSIPRRVMMVEPYEVREIEK